MILRLMAAGYLDRLRRASWAPTLKWVPSEKIPADAFLMRSFAVTSDTIFVDSASITNDGPDDRAMTPRLIAAGYSDRLRRVSWAPALKWPTLAEIPAPLSMLSFLVTSDTIFR